MIPMTSVARESVTDFLCVPMDVPGSSPLAALATVARSNGLTVDLAGLRALAGVGTGPADGVSMMYAAGRCGFDALPLEGEFHQLPELVFPAIVTFRDEAFYVLHAVDETSAVVGNTTTGAVVRMEREDFVALWTGDIFQVTPNDGLADAQLRLHRLQSPWYRLAAMVGVVPFSLARLMFAVAVLVWFGMMAFVPVVTSLLAGCALASLWIVAFPKGCSKCGATSTLAGKLPVAPMGVVFYAALAVMTVIGSPLVVRAGLFAAVGAHVGLVGILAARRIACYPCLLTALLAWTAAGLTIRVVGVEALVFPVSLVGTVVVVLVAAKLAKQGSALALVELAAKVSAEPVVAGQARMVVYTREHCAICAYFKGVIEPTLAEEFGEALVVGHRSAERLDIAVPAFFVSGTVRIGLTQVGTDEMMPRLGAAVQAALDPVSEAMAAVGGVQLTGFLVGFGA